MQSDGRLVELARAGHEPAQTAIVQRYRPALVRYCTGLLGADRAEDAVQQALANAHAALTAPDDRPLQLRPWLYRLAHNAALNVLRASRDQAFADSGTAGAGEPPEEVLERRQRLDELLAAIAALPRAQRDSLLLRELEGRSHEEIASALGVSVGAARQKLFRARAAVRAACTAVTPTPLLARLIELGSVQAAGGAALTKAAAGVLATGALAGGTVSTGVLSEDHPRARTERAQQTATGNARQQSPAPATERLASVGSPRGEAGRSRARTQRDDSEPNRSRRSSQRERPGRSGDGADHEERRERGDDEHGGDDHSGRGRDEGGDPRHEDGGGRNERGRDRDERGRDREADGGGRDERGEGRGENGEGRGNGGVGREDDEGGEDRHPGGGRHDEAPGRENRGARPHDGNGGDEPGHGAPATQNAGSENSRGGPPPPPSTGPEKKHESPGGPQPKPGAEGKPPEQPPGGGHPGKPDGG